MPKLTLDIPESVGFERIAWKASKTIFLSLRGPSWNSRTETAIFEALPPETTEKDDICENEPVECTKQEESASLEFCWFFPRFCPVASNSTGALFTRRVRGIAVSATV